MLSSSQATHQVSRWTGPLSDTRGVADGFQATEEASRKRSRLGLPVLAVSQQPPSKLEPKRRAANPAAKIVRKVKKAAEDSRLGGRRQKTAADVHFEEACQAVLGSRVGVWWEDDRCYYKVRPKHELMFRAREGQ